MRVTVVLWLMSLFFALFLWVTLSGALLFFGALFFLLYLVIMLGYPDTAMLFFLGAREVRSGDESAFFEAAAQESYKLAVPMPKLYFYNGSLERGFVLQKGKSSSLVLSKGILEICGPEELSAICFEFLLQVKKGMAVKRTKVMFLLGFLSWLTHAVANLFLALVPVKEFRQSIDGLLNFFLHPCMELLFKFTLGESYFRKLNVLIKDFPLEQEMVNKLALRLRKPLQIYSLPSRKLIEISAIPRSSHYQNIVALEFLPHEWDFFFDQEGLINAKEV